MHKKGLWISIFIILLVAGLSIVFCWPLITDAVDKNKKYTKEDMQVVITERDTALEKVNEYKVQVLLLNNLVAQYEDDYETYQSIIKSLRTEVNNLQAIHEGDLSAISVLNRQIEDFETLLQRNNSELINIRNRIAELEKSIEVYEEYISNLDLVNDIVLTFMFDGSVYCIKTISAGTTTSVELPTLTEGMTFNGWKVSDEIIDLNTHIFNENTTIIADITYAYNVSFVVNDEEIDSQLVSKNSYATLPNAPTKDGYRFDGWSLDGETVVDISTLNIVGNTTFIAVFTKVYCVTFMYNDNIVNSQTVVENGYITEPVVPINLGYTLAGWSFDGENVANLTNYNVITNVTLYAVYEYDPAVVQALKTAIANTSYTKPTIASIDYSVELVNSDKYVFEVVSQDWLFNIQVDWQECLNNSDFAQLITSAAQVVSEYQTIGSYLSNKLTETQVAALNTELNTIMTTYFENDVVGAFLHVAENGAGCNFRMTSHSTDASYRYTVEVNYRLADGSIQVEDYDSSAKSVVTIVENIASAILSNNNSSLTLTLDTSATTAGLGTSNALTRA